MQRPLPKDASTRSRTTLQHQPSPGASMVGRAWLLSKCNNTSQKMKTCSKTSEPNIEILMRDELVRNQTTWISNSYCNIKPKQSLEHVRDIETNKFTLAKRC